jgi:hypothetical protein
LKTVGEIELNGEIFQFSAISAGKIKSVEKGVKVLAETKSRNIPLITERDLGKGSMICVNFNINDLLHESDSASQALKLLRKLIERLHAPAVKIEGDIKVMSALRKGKWVGGALLAKDCGAAGGKNFYPVSGKLQVDLAKLGFKSGEYQVFSLARDREMSPSGKKWNWYGKNSWTPKMIKDGIDIFIPKNSLAGLKLEPENMNEAQRLLWESIKNDKAISKIVLRKWKSHTWQRDYEHEIIAICPVGEKFPMRKGQ